MFDVQGLAGFYTSHNKIKMLLICDINKSLKGVNLPGH